MPFARRISVLALLLFALVGTGTADAARVGSALRYVETADGVRSYQTRGIVRWTHARLVFAKELDRIAVGHETLLELDILSPQEVLLLGREVGRTSIIVWYGDGTNETFLFNVTPDLSVLSRALAEIHESLLVESAPDRSAIILRGAVPDVGLSRTAESVARSYLAAGVAKVAPPQPVLGAVGDDATEPMPVPASAPDRSANTDLAVINLIRVTSLPLSTEEKIERAVAEIGGEDVRVRRMVHGELPDDAVDSLILEGSARDQVALVRILNVAARSFLGGDAEVGIEVLADEGGGLLTGRSDKPLTNRVRGGRGGSIGGNSVNDNEIKSNIGRSKLLSVAGGRLLSMIEVADVPQVRVSVRVHEVNLTRLKQWRPDVAMVTSGFRSGSFTPTGGQLQVEGDPTQRVGSDGGSEVENAFQLVRGALTNQFQVGTSDFSLDMLFSLLEQEGISRRMSSPTLTVLSGEVALFHVGGSVPIQSSFSPAFGGAADDGFAPGVFSTVEFQPFGVELSVRPMVGEGGTITLDVSPTIVDPDTDLTQAIATSSGTPLATTAFRTRSLQTSARLRDAQPLVIGGLISREETDDRSFTPGVHRLPILGWLGKAFSGAKDDFELFVVVTPTVIRDRIDGLELWEFPGYFELLQSSIAPVAGPQGEAATGEGSAQEVSR